MTDDRRRALEAQLSAYLDDELEPRELHDVEALLAADEEARVLLEQLRATIEAVQSLPRARASEHLIESLRARMERQSLFEGRPATVRLGAGGRLSLRWVAAAAVIGLTVTAGYLMWPLARGRLNPPNERLALAPQQPKLAPASEGESRRYSAFGENDSQVPAAGAPAVPPIADALGKSVQLRGFPDPEKGVSAKPETSMLAAGVELAHAVPVPPAEEPSPAAAVAKAPASVPPQRRHVETVAVADDDFAAAGRKDVAGATMGYYGLSEGRTVGPPARGATLVELTFADARGRDEAVREFRGKYAFHPIGPATQPEAAVEAFERRVPDEESARRIVEGLQQFVNTTERVRVVTQAAEQERYYMGGRVAGDAAGSSHSQRGAANLKFGASPTTAATVAADERLSTQPGDELDATHEVRGGIGRQKYVGDAVVGGGYGGMGGKLALGEIAQEAAASRPMTPMEFYAGAYLAREMPVTQEETESIPGSHVLRLYVRVESPATMPAAAGSPTAATLPATATRPASVE